MTKTSLAVGTLLWLGATALLLDDAWRQGHLSVQHALMPCLTGGTVWAAVMLHHSVARLSLGAALAFLALAAVGSASTVYSTLGRTAEARDQNAAGARSANSALAARREALASARSSLAAADAEVGRECKSGFGKSCAGWRSTAEERRNEVRRVEAELSTMREAPVDARADAAVRLAMLLGVSDELWLRSLIDALDPVLLPFFLEFGSILAFAAAFPARAESVGHRERDVGSGERDVRKAQETVAGPWPQDLALEDLLTMIKRGVEMDQRLLARRWSRSDSCVSKWMRDWEDDGLVGRSRDGRSRRPTAA